MKFQKKFIILFLLFAFTIAGAFAVSLATTYKINPFTIHTGNAQIELKEILDNTTYDGTTTVTANLDNAIKDTLYRDETWICNKGEISLQCYIVLGLPYSITNDSPQFIFYNANDVEGINEKWSFEGEIGYAKVNGQSKEEREGLSKTDYYRYFLYSYNEKLDADAETETLFNKIKYVGELKGDRADETPFYYSDGLVSKTYSSGNTSSAIVTNAYGIDYELTNETVSKSDLFNDYFSIIS